ncbi:hypothetical protein CQW23_03276 [Capsicum baccatum]|uniref:Ubiquitin-like protease family profile domain-containing protein n=1 Tax=Capsicum baccatum TaxID=33114 RepID=A0A2G2XBD7_CAPBA|nr:hypothetical protein CQW23_03276 [Capsicum baccatum]
MNVELDSQQLIPDELLQSINLDYLHSEKVVQHNCQTSDEKIDDTCIEDHDQDQHLIEYINEFRMHAAVPWNTVEDIFIPINIKKKHHWVLAVLSFSERCIFLYDSYESSGHYAAVFAEIEKIAKIISLCLQACDFYVKKGIDHQNHPRYKDKESSDIFDVLFEDDLPQQPSGSS